MKAVDVPAAGNVRFNDLFMGFELGLREVKSRLVICRFDCLPSDGRHAIALVASAFQQAVRIGKLGATKTMELANNLGSHYGGRM